MATPNMVEQNENVKDATFIVDADGNLFQSQTDTGFYVAKRPIDENEEFPTMALVGRWRDAETSIVYWDEVEWFDQDSEEDALAVAKSRNELAIWDIAGNKVIRV